MCILRLIIKTIIALCANILIFKPNSLLSAVVMFSLAYGLETYYIWYFKDSDMRSNVYIGNGGAMATLISFLFMLAAPLIAISISFYCLDALLPKKASEIIGGGTIMVASFGSVIYDVIHAVRVINPSFLVFEEKTDSGMISQSDEANSGFITDDDE